MTSFAILTDITKCIGCGACAMACKEVNQMPGEVEPKLTAKTLTTVEHHGDVHVRRQCMHCVSPTCVSVCPVAALEKTPEGPVIYHETRCIGCRYCMMACPFGIPKYEWESISPKVNKCTMCAPRIKEGLQPGCTTVCPTGATIFGERDVLIKTANERIAAKPDLYVNRIYGVHEVGGTCVFYLSDIPFEELGFQKTRMDTAYPDLTWAALSQVPTVASVGGVLMCGIWWITHRRMKLERERSENNQHGGEGHHE